MLVIKNPPFNIVFQIMMPLSGHIIAILCLHMMYMPVQISVHISTYISTWCRYLYRSLSIYLPISPHDAYTCTDLCPYTFLYLHMMPILVQVDLHIPSYISTWCLNLYRSLSIYLAISTHDAYTCTGLCPYT